MHEIKKRRGTYAQVNLPSGQDAVLLQADPHRRAVRFGVTGGGGSNPYHLAVNQPANATDQIVIINFAPLMFRYEDWGSLVTGEWHAFAGSATQAAVFASYEV